MSRLGPGDVPGSKPVTVIHGDGEGLTDEAQPQEPSHREDVINEMTARLQRLREPFPPDRIEKKPQPMWKGAWDDQPKAKCEECGGYHPYANTLHLEYVGHANCTDRLLEVDPFWEWEPLAYTAEGLPLFTKNGGLWIKLTICGVTRIGYGDGKEPKEIIGDAIRNAAMRFGVALDLWAKIDLHAERNPGDGQTQAQRSPRQDREVHRGGSSDTQSAGGPPADEPPRAPNQDALDSLGSVCDENGLDRRTMRDRYEAWAQSKRYKERDLLIAHKDRIYAFAQYLIEQLPEPPDEGADDGKSEGEPELPAPSTGESDIGADNSGQEAGADAGDEAQAGDMF